MHNSLRHGSAVPEGVSNSPLFCAFLSKRNYIFVIIAEFFKNLDYFNGGGGYNELKTMQN